MRHIVLSLICTLMFVGCSKEPFEGNQRPEPVISQTDPMQLIAESEQQWTGVAVTLHPRVYVSYPRWSAEVPISVAEIVDGEPIAFPDAEWNSWGGDRGDVADQWVAVQSVATDREYRLWVLDTGNPRFEGVISGAPKLVAFEPATREVVARFDFQEPIITDDSYLNDVRVDDEEGRAYVTDSGDGALIIIDLESGEMWRMLDEHPSTQSQGVSVTIDGQTWGDGNRDVHADGIALHQGHWLYWKALTGTTLYRVPLDVLREEVPDEEEIIDAIEEVAEVGPTDGLITDALGRVYLTDIDDHAISWYAPDNEILDVLIQDDRLAWPDSMACQDDSLYVTTSRLHEGNDPRAPYALYRIQATADCP